MTDREMTQTTNPTAPNGTKDCAAKWLAAVTAAICISWCAVSCVNIESAVPGDVNAQIVYSLSPVKTGTKAATFDSFPTSDTFGSIAMQLPDGKNWIDNSEESTVYIGGTATGSGSTGTGTSATITGEEISYRDGVWKAWKSGAIYWWPRTGTLSFFSWSPYDLMEKGLSFNTTDGLRIDGWTMLNKAGYGSSATDGCVDILTARNLDCRRGTSGSTSGVTGSSASNGVSTIFKHALCKVSFVISLDYEPTDDKKWTIEKVELKDIYTTGDFVSTTWSNYSDVQDYVNEFSTPIEPKLGENSVLLPQTMMLPQPLMRSSDGSRIPRIEITCYDGKSGHYESEGVWVKDKTTLTGVLYSNASEFVRWKEGSSYTYHLYLTDKTENYIEFDASTDDWSYSDAGDIELK